jgi:hypothetical protein
MGLRRLCSFLLCLIPVTAFAQSQLTPSSLAFPVTAVGSTSSAQTVVLNNYSGSALPISSITLTGPFTMDSSNCGNSVASGSQCYVYVKAAPTAAGTFAGTITVVDSYGTSTVALSATTLPLGSTLTTITSSGSPGAYALTGTVTGSHGAFAPTGNVSFADTSNANLALGSSPLGSPTFGFGLSTYSPPLIGNGPGAIASGDFNGDGKIDIVVANAGYPGCGSACPNSLSILLGNGNGTFTVSTITNVNGSGGGVVTGDFNGDGKLDIAATDSADSTVILFLGKGDGTFTKVSTQPSTGAYPGILATGDFNKDGKADLAILNSTNSVTILLGNGDGTFTAKASPPIDNYGNAIALGDFNGDGNLDIAVACEGTYPSTPSTIDIFLGTGTGTFTAGATISASGTGSYNSFGTLAVGDFNGDKKVDLVTYVDIPAANTNQADTLGIQTFLGKGDGTFTAQTPIVTGDDIYEANLGVADFNGDGNPDLALADDTNFSIYLGNGNGTFQPPVSVPGARTEPTYLTQTIADFNGDGLPDLAIADGDLNLVRLQISNPTASASATVTGVSIPGSGSSHTVDAAYAGNSNFTSSTSSTINLTGSPLATRLTIAANPTAVTYGGQVVLTATLTPYISGNLKTDTELVTFTSGGTTLGTAPLITGVATLNVTSLPVGTDTINATYAGDTNFTTTSTTTAAQVVVSAAPPTLTLSPTSLTFTTQTVGARSTAQTITVTNTGTTPLIITAVTASGDFAQTNTCTSVAVAGTCAISVTFTPTSAGSRTGTITITDNAASSPQTVSLTGTGAPLAVTPASTSLSITAPGGSVTDVLQITPATGFSGSVSLTCAVTYQGTGTPNDLPTCALNPASLTLTAGTPGSTTLTVSTTAASASLARPANLNHPGLAKSATIAFAGLFFLCILPTRRRHYGKLFTLLLLIGLGSLVGCGGSPSSSTSNPGTTTANSVPTTTTLTLNLQ